MTAQLSEYATSSPMAGDENGGGSSSNDSGGGDESAAGRRVVMIAFKMDDNNCDIETVAGPSRDDSNSEPHAIVLQQSPPPPSFSSDGNTAGKTAYFIVLYNVVLCVCKQQHLTIPIEGGFPPTRGKTTCTRRWARRHRTSGSSRIPRAGGRARSDTFSFLSFRRCQLGPLSRRRRRAFVFVVVVVVRCTLRCRSPSELGVRSEFRCLSR